MTLKELLNQLTAFVGNYGDEILDAPVDILIEHDGRQIEDSCKYSVAVCNYKQEKFTGVSRIVLHNMED